MTYSIQLYISSGHILKYLKPGVSDETPSLGCKDSKILTHTIKKILNLIFYKKVSFCFLKILWFGSIKMKSRIRIYRIRNTETMYVFTSVILAIHIQQIGNFLKIVVVKKSVNAIFWKKEFSFPLQQVRFLLLPNCIFQSILVVIPFYWDFLTLL